METWSNEQVLKFIRVMWDRHRHEKEGALLASSKDSAQSMSTMGASVGSVGNAASVKSAAEKVEPKSGPSDPATVVAAAKSAFEALGDAGGALLLTEEPQRSISDSSPMRKIQPQDGMCQGIGLYMTVVVVSRYFWHHILDINW